MLLTQGLPTATLTMESQMTGSAPPPQLATGATRAHSRRCWPWRSCTTPPAPWPGSGSATSTAEYSPLSSSSWISMSSLSLRLSSAQRSARERALATCASASQACMQTADLWPYTLTRHVNDV